MDVFLNGKFVSRDDAKISVFDHGLLYGDAIYETLRTYGGVVWQIEKHVQRLFRSAKLIGLKLPWTREEIERWIVETVDRNYKAFPLGNMPAPYHLSAVNGKREFVMKTCPEFKIRVTVTRGVNDFDFITTKKPTLIIAVESLKEVPKSAYKHGVSAITFPIERIFPEAKTTNMIPAILARQAMEKAFEAFLVDRDGFVTEGTITNVFIVKNGVLVTPCEHALAGTTQEVVLHIARKCMPVSLKKISLKNFYDADECFCSNVLKGIVPVVCVDGKKIGNGRVGKWTERIFTEFQRKVEAFVRGNRNSAGGAVQRFSLKRNKLVT